jgi:hypothetical protein
LSYNSLYKLGGKQEATTPHLPSIHLTGKGKLMLENSIVQIYTETQYADTKEIFCPMCEETHENNTWCQCPGWEN